MSEEGINGVLSGTEVELREYEDRLRRELLMFDLGTDGSRSITQVKQSSRLVNKVRIFLMY